MSILWWIAPGVSKTWVRLGGGSVSGSQKCQDLQVVVKQTRESGQNCSQNPALLRRDQGKALLGNVFSCGPGIGDPTGTGPGIDASRSSCSLRSPLGEKLLAFLEIVCNGLKSCLQPQPLQGQV